MRKALLILAMPIVLMMVGCAEEDASRDPQVNGSAMVKGMPIDFGAEDPEIVERGSRGQQRVVDLGKDIR